MIIRAEKFSDILQRQFSDYENRYIYYLRRVINNGKQQFAQNTSRNGCKIEKYGIIGNLLIIFYRS